jgi:6-pyruvoyltetrahydropterin/6-carboxytetrahydropterin synthase
MIIRKLFKFEGSHIVRNCSSDRCKKSIHGHSYVVEIKLKSNNIDNGQMVVDFGLLKNQIGVIIDSFDHAYSMWHKESIEYKTFIKNNSARWIEMPVSPSAEMYALMFFAIIKKILEKTEFRNGEKDVSIYSVICHETSTGYAEAFQEDYENIWIKNGFDLKNIIFSEQIKREWKDSKMWEKINNQTKHCFINAVIPQTH